MKKKVQIIIFHLIINVAYVGLYAAFHPEKSMATSSGNGTIEFFWGFQVLMIIMMVLSIKVSKLCFEKDKKLLVCSYACSSLSYLFQSFFFLVEFNLRFYDFKKIGVEESTLFIVLHTIILAYIIFRYFERIDFKTDLGFFSVVTIFVLMIDHFIMNKFGDGSFFTLLYEAIF